ncbi:MAG: 30S ribosomal protein S6 [Erysipelotrichaceae bacterium]|jgi:small subunit ribosomal protein S6|nr:30S ribosomal protein S6 [Erysipelotrichaceae bacterium]
MKKYEVMYILKSSLEEEARQNTINTLHAIITDGQGTIEKIDEWGMKEFAYRIDDMTKGYYVVTTFVAEPHVVEEFDRICRINANVVRNMIVNLEEK